jgi:hypothetical protein
VPKTVTVTRSPNNDNIRVRADETVLSFKAGTDPGQATVDLGPGTHILTYVVVMPPGTQVTLGITTPPESKWSRTQVVPSDGIIAGAKKFSVS